MLASFAFCFRTCLCISMTMVSCLQLAVLWIWASFLPACCFSRKSCPVLRKHIHTAANSIHSVIQQGNSIYNPFSFPLLSSIHPSIHSPFTINSFSSAKYSDFVYYVRLPQLVDVHYIVHFIKDAWRSEESLIITKRSFRLLSPKTNLDSANFIVNKVTWKFWL